MSIPPAFNFASVINAAVAPVVLVTASAILLSGYSSKYANIADRLRDLAAEHRQPHTSPARSRVLRAQLRLFRKRIMAVWAASALLSFAVLLFLATVLLSIFSSHAAVLGRAGAVCLVSGLILIGGAVCFELYEIRLARRAVDAELSDIFSSD